MNKMRYSIAVTALLLLASLTLAAIPAAGQGDSLEPILKAL